MRGAAGGGGSKNIKICVTSFMDGPFLARTQPGLKCCNLKYIPVIFLFVSLPLPFLFLFELFSLFLVKFYFVFLLTNAAVCHRVVSDEDE